MDMAGEAFSRFIDGLNAQWLEYRNAVLEEATKKVEEYLENKYKPPHEIPLWLRGEREAVQKVADAIRALKKQPHDLAQR